MMENRKAVILCGGKGMRLRPLTATTPKPLLKVGGVPVVINILNMLKRQGINGVAMTLGYMGSEIERAVKENARLVSGMDIRFYYEEAPLGSAGGVKRAADFLDCNFAVICGDAWCDFDIASAFSLLEKSDCDGVIVTSTSSSPLEYGLVITDDSGRVESFTEKPSWSGVSSKTVNTGIYVLKKGVLDLIPDGKYDFGRDLFNKMLSQGYSLYTCPANGVWWDIGDPEGYYRCNMSQTGGENYIGEGCGISEEASISRSVILDGVKIEGGCRVTGGVIGNGAVIMKDSVIKEGVIIGEGAVISENTVLYPGVFIREGEFVEKNSKIYNPLHGVCLFANRCMRFEISMMTDSFNLALGRAIRRAMGEAKVGVSNDERGMCEKIAGQIAKGAAQSYGDTVYYGSASPFLASFIARNKGEGLGLTVHVSFYTVGQSCGIRIDCFDENGIYPGAVFESNLKYAAKWGNSSTVCDEEYKISKSMKDVYVNSIIKEYDPKIACLKIKFDGISNIYPYISAAFDKLFTDKKRDNTVLTVHSDINRDMEGIEFEGIFFDREHILCAVILNYINNGVTEIPLPHRAPVAVKNFVRDNGARLTLYSLCRHDLRENAVAGCYADLPALIDPCYALFSFAEFIIKNKLSAKQLKCMLPDFSYVAWDEYIPERLKSDIIDCQRHAGEGFYLRGYDGVRIIPENSNIVSMCVEAANMDDVCSMMKKANGYLKSFIDNNMQKGDTL